MRALISQEIGLGRGWVHPPLGRDEVHVSSTVLRRLGVQANSNQNVTLKIDFIKLFEDAGAFGTDKTLDAFLLSQFA